jgi:hypothetical protein
VEEDQLIWRAEKNEHYSVLSAYRICMEEIAGNSHLHRAENWDSIWRIKVPPKVKNLIWRVCRNCLPTRARLLDKGVHCPSLCALCDEIYEDTIHILFDYHKARNVCRESCLLSKVDLAMQNNNTAAEIIFALLQDLPQDQAHIFCMILWSL